MKILLLAAGGLILPFTPRRTWAKFIGPQPAPAVAVSDSHPSQRRTATQVGSQVVPFQGKPFALPKRLALPNPDTLAPECDPESVAQITAVDVDSASRTSTEEIQVEPSPRCGRQLSRTEGRRSRGSSSREDSSQELKMLRELARASFPRHRRDGDHDTEHRLGSPGTVGSGAGSLLQIASPIMSPRDVDDKRYVRRRRQFLGMPHARSDAESISVATSDADSIFLQDDLSSVPEIANLVGPPVISVASDRSRFSKGSGYVESHSMHLRDTSGAIRPLEER